MIGQAADVSITDAIIECSDASKLEFFQRRGKKTVLIRIPGCEFALCAHRNVYDSHAVPAELVEAEKSKLRSISKEEAQRAVPDIFRVYFNRLS